MGTITVDRAGFKWQATEQQTIILMSLFQYHVF